MVLSTPAAGFIGASVTLVLVIVFMILMVILVRQCLAFVSKRNAIRAQMEHQQRVREQIRQRRGSVSEPIPATFDWHHSIRIEGTPPPSYVEAKELPKFDDDNDGGKEKKIKKGEITIYPADEEKIQENGVHANKRPDESKEVIVHIENQGSNSNTGGGGGTEDQVRTFATDYTEFNSA